MFAIDFANEKASKPAASRADPHNGQVLTLISAAELQTIKLKITSSVSSSRAPDAFAKKLAQ
jgi:hypothetical protein